jgi:phage recombination protein Bet
MGQNNNEIQATENKKSVIEFMANRYGMEKEAFQAVVKETVMPGNVKNEEFVAFLSVAKEYNLNPLTKEVYAFPTKGGGIQPIVSIDGWCRIINEHQQLDGIVFEDEKEGNDVVAITCKIYRKDRQHPITATEYLEECKGNSQPWNKWPRRMLRHKALIQAARYAFGFSGIYDQDEVERMKDITPVSASKTANIPDNINFTQEQPKQENKKVDIEDVVSGGENGN